MKAKSRNYARDVDHMEKKYRNAITANYNSFEKMNPLETLPKMYQ